MQFWENRLYAWRLQQGKGCNCKGLLGMEGQWNSGRIACTHGGCNKERAAIARDSLAWRGEAILGESFVRMAATTGKGLEL